jgi:hypothetical protein
MGLTIHYSLRSSTRSPKKARELLARLRGRALDVPFERVDDIIELSGPECNYEQYDREHPSRWLLIQAGAFVDDPRNKGYSYGVSPTHIIAFSTWPGNGCEEANFGLCRYPATIEVDNPVRRGQRQKIRTRRGGWRWGSFCKTQYASNPEVGGIQNFLRCHLSVVRMLDHAKELGILQSVSDEGDYWEKRDIEALAREVGHWNEMVAAFAGQMKDIVGDELISAIAAYPDFEHLEAAGASCRKGEA